MVKQETNIQRDIMLALSEYGIPLRMQSGLLYTEYGDRIRVGIKGISDLLFIGKGYIAFIETKTPVGKASKEQIEFIEQIKAQGHIAGFARSVDDALKLIGVKW